MEKIVLARVSILLVLAITSTGCAEAGESVADCDANPKKLGLHFTVTRQHDEGDARKSLVQHIQLWRRDRQVAYVHEERELTEIWDLVSDGRQKLVRYFDAYKRAIEYQPEDVDTESGPVAWSERTQIVSESKRGGMTLSTTEGTACERVEVYTSRIDDRSRLRWRPALQAVETLEFRTDDGDITWSLDSVITDPAVVDEQFLARARYQTTDFVDIGDNESDPWLQKMINIGFIDDAHGHEH